MPWRLELFLVMLLPFLSSTHSMHITGSWSSQDEKNFKVIAKFGFQIADSLRIDYTRGFVYGNVTSKLKKESPDDKILLSIVDRSYFPALYEISKSSDGFSCDKALKKLTAVAFDRRCLPKGGQDFFRWVPCPRGAICPDEDDADNVIPGHQLTYRVQNKYAARFWYVVLISCRFDSSCNWTSVSNPFAVDYDIWLVNGNPLVKYSNPFEHQFSFDEQDTTEIYLVAVVVFFFLSLLQLRACRLLKVHIPRRTRALFLLSLVQTLSAILNLIHVFIYSFNGQGAVVLRWVGDVLYILGSGLFILLLLLLARGWSISHSEKRLPYWIYVLWGTMQLVDLALFIWNSQAVDAIEEIDIFETNPGWGILGMRIVYMCWFLVELRKTVSAEPSEEKIRFLIHFGAGYLVWFVYLPVLGIAASSISLMWRFKVILSVSYLANFLGIVVMIHLFWPQSTNRRFFADKDRTDEMILLPQDELDEFEKDLVSDELHPDDPHEEDEF